MTRIDRNPGANGQGVVRDLASNEGIERIEDRNPYEGDKIQKNRGEKKGSNANEAGEKQDESPKEHPPIDSHTINRRLDLRIRCLITDHSAFSARSNRSEIHNNEDILAKGRGENQLVFGNHFVCAQSKGENHQIATVSSIEALISLVLFEISRTRLGR